MRSTLGLCLADLTKSLLYDIHKKIRRVESQRHHLELLAEKVAFHLQLSGKREATKEELLALSRELFDHVMEPTAAEKVLNELIDPCNILTPTTWMDRIGFGHLRYQEYLAARELRNNRGIAIAPLVFSAWWKGVLSLFAQMHESLDWIVEELADCAIDSVMLENVLAMISSGPQRGREELREFVTEKAALDQRIEKHLRAIT